MEQSNEVRRLPLWKNCLEKMLLKGVDHGDIYTAEFFEHELSQERNTYKYGLAISHIRRALEHKGLYLSGVGQKGNQFVIIPAGSNSNVMSSYSRKAFDILKRGVILGTNTDTKLLTDSEKKRHQSILERTATRAALVARAAPIKKFVLKHKPELLKPKEDHDKLDTVSVP